MPLGIVAVGIGAVVGAVGGVVCRGAVVAAVLGMVEGTEVSAGRFLQPVSMAAVSAQITKVI